MKFLDLNLSSCKRQTSSMYFETGEEFKKFEKCKNLRVLISYSNRSRDANSATFILIHLLISLKQF